MSVERGETDRSVLEQEGDVLTVPVGVADDDGEHGERRELFELARRAQLLHRVFSAVVLKNPRPSGAQLGRTYGFSRSLWSECKAGRQWVPATVLEAAVLCLEE